jgi:hypothetical protein
VSGRSVMGRKRSDGSGLCSAQSSIVRAGVAAQHRLGAGRARKTSVAGRGHYGDVKSPQICVMMIFARARALIGSGRVLGDATKHALGEVLVAPLTGHLTNGWSGRDP